MRALLALLLAITPPAHAARPFVTDDARVVDAGSCQIETFVKRQQRQQEGEFWILPACNPGVAEFTAGLTRLDTTPGGDTRTAVLQAKMLLKPLAVNGSGFALTLGLVSGTANHPYVNAVGSFSFADDRVVLHTNLGAIRDTAAEVSRGTWGAGAEVLLLAPRLYGIVESYGQRGDKPTLHTGLRLWIVPNRLQVDASVGRQQAAEVRRFVTVGLRILW